MRKKKVYLSGKMKGLSRDEYMKIFHRAEMELSNADYWVISPIRFWGCRWAWVYPTIERVFGKKMAYTLVLLYDLWRLSKCDYIYKIPGWQESRGAMIEGAWAFHSGIKLVPIKKRASIDKRMAKFVEMTLNNPTELKDTTI